MISALIFEEISRLSAMQGLSCFADGDGLIIKTGDFKIHITSVGTSFAVRCFPDSFFDNICKAYGTIHQQREKSTFIVAREDIKELVSVFAECALDSAAADPVFDNPDVDSIENTESEARSKLRKGQAWLRNRAMIYWNNSCALTGVSVPEILETCHIKPWSDPEITAKERLSIENTIVMCVHLHRLFDAGLISFADNGALMISEKLSPESIKSLNLSEEMKLSRTLTEKQKEFLEYHRINIFK